MIVAVHRERGSGDEGVLSKARRPAGVTNHRDVREIATGQPGDLVMIERCGQALCRCCGQSGRPSVNRIADVVVEEEDPSPIPQSRQEQAEIAL
jgi:hypothetical protein